MDMKADRVRARRSYQAWIANETLEDYSLRYAPRSFRKWPAFVIVNTALGGISFLALEAIGGAITLSYGFSNAFAAIIVVSLLVFVTNLPIAYYSSRYNVDMDLLTRGAGFGYIGSTITSLIYASFTFIFFALEAAIMAQALEIYFGLPIVIGYIVSSIVIIPITFLGITLISKLQLLTQPFWVVMLIAPFIFIFYKQPEVLSDWVNFAAESSDGSGFNYLFFGAATGVLFSLVVQIGEQVDYLRFLPDRTKSNRFRWWAAVVSAGPGWILIGGLKILAGSLLAVLAVNAGVPAADAVEPIHMYIEAYGFISQDAWIVLTLATLFVLISQVKINVTNAYAGSLAWSNFYSRVTHFHPGRVVWLVFNILISLLLMLLGIFETLEIVLAVYSNVAIAWIGAIFADLVVLKPLGISPSFVEFKRAHLYNINPVGCGAMLVASIVSVTAYAGGLGELAEAYSAMLSLGTALVVAVALGLVTRGRYYIARQDSLADRIKGQITVRCGVCDYPFEPEDMAYCPFYEGPICSLCCSLDAHCHDICKHPDTTHHDGVPVLADSGFRRQIPPDLVQRLAKFLGVFLALAVVTAAAFLLTYRMIDLDPLTDQAGNARLLFRVYTASLVLIGLGAWWIVLSHESRESAERELVDSLEKLSEARHELMQSEQLATIGQLTATVSHELRNPLGTISSSVSVLQDQLDPSDPELGPVLERTQRSIRRCARIIEDLLDFSRYREAILAPVQIDRLIADLLDEQQLEDMAGLKRDLQSGATVLVDGERFRQALVNLLQNAQQSVTGDDESAIDGGAIEVSTRQAGDRFEMSISDQGAGMTPDVREKIFKPLYSTKAFGIGLGMPLVKRIVEQHKGGIEVESEWGRGTTATIWLPLAPGHGGESTRESA